MEMSLDEAFSSLDNVVDNMLVTVSDYFDRDDDGVVWAPSFRTNLQD